MSDIESLHWRMADGADSYSVHAFNAEAKLFIVKRGVLKKYLETNLAPTTVRKKRFKDGKVRIPNVEVGDFLFVRSQSDFIPAGWTRLFVRENHAGGVMKRRYFIEEPMSSAAQVHGHICFRSEEYPKGIVIASYYNRFAREMAEKLVKLANRRLQGK